MKNVGYEVRSYISGTQMKDIGEISEDMTSENISDTSSVRSFKSNMRRITGQKIRDNSEDDDGMMTDSSFMSS